MTLRASIEQRLHTLDEISGIMGSMKMLARHETRKLSRHIEAQHRLVNTIMAAAADFLSAYPVAPNGHGRLSQTYLLVGSERGFCGDFNKKLITALAACQARDGVADARVIVVGGKLHAKLAADPRLVGAVEGASAAEEVENVLARLVQLLYTEIQTHGPLALTVLHQREDAEEVDVHRVFPPFEDLPPPSPRFAHPPCLHLTPDDFFAALLDQYLFATLHEVLFVSLMAENRQRMQHLEGAVRRLEEQMDELTLKRNRLRQEEITEEIEVILLHVESAFRS